MTLYELTGQFLELLQMAEEDELSAEALADTMEAVGLEIEDKVDGYAKIIKSLEAEIAGYKSEIDRMSARKRTLENNIDRLKKCIEGAMLATGKTKFKTSLFSFSIQKNPPSIAYLDESKVPKCFLIKQPCKIDKKAVLDYLKDHKKVRWGFVKQTESLRIR